MNEQTASKTETRKGFMTLAVGAVFIIGALSSCSSEPKEPTWQAKWQQSWNQLPPESKATICASWDVTPTSTAIQVETAMGIPTGLGFGKKMLKQVC